MNEEKFIRNRHKAFFEPKVYKGRKKNKPMTIGDIVKKQKG